MSIVDKSELLKTLRILSPAIDKNPNILGSNCVAFSNGKAYAFNEWLGITTPTVVDLNFTIEATNLQKLLQNYSSNEVDISLIGTMVQFKVGRGKFTLPNLDSPLLSRFQSIIPIETWFKAVGADFTEGVKLCTIPNGPVTGIYIDGSEMLSCRSGICHYSFDGQVDKFRISNKAAVVIASHEAKELMVLPTWVILRNDDCDLYVRRLYDEDYPATMFRTFIDDVNEGDNLCNFEFHPQLLSILETAVTMQDNPLDKVRLDFNAGSITVSVAGKGGMFTDMVEVECNMPTDDYNIELCVSNILPIIKKGIDEITILRHNDSVVMKLDCGFGFSYYEKIQ